MRSWTMIDESAEVEFSSVKQGVIDSLVAKWNELDRKIEERSWADEDRMSDFADYQGDRAVEEREQAIYDALEQCVIWSQEHLNQIGQKAEDAFWAEERERLNAPHREKEEIEAMLSEFGVRMMRPYEHWNEDEQYMQYMENRYDY